MVIVRSLNSIHQARGYQLIKSSQKSGNSSAYLNEAHWLDK